MSQLAALQAASTLHDVAALLGFKASSLAFILYKKPAVDKYRKFDIPKRMGGVRQITAPADDLKLLQRRLADLLQNCQDEINQKLGRTDDGPNPDRLAHGFKRRRSIITNAKAHRRRRFVFNLDLENFFPSINFGRVRGYFLKDKNFALKPTVATVIAQIACFEGALPQGSPCSPVISNLIGHVLDIHLVKLAAKEGCRYTRYADDLTFSTNKPEFPASIAVRSALNEHEWEIGPSLAALIAKGGFAANVKKTRMQYRDSRQEVTGLVVNRKVNVRAEYRHSVRAMVHHLFTKGSFFFESIVIDPTGAKTVVQQPGRLEQLHGMLGFIDGVDLQHRKRPAGSRRSPEDLSSKELIYRRFLLYKDFYASSVPVLVCEGKTDNVYITHAIRSLANAYPKLATVDPNGKIAILLRRFRYSGTSTGRILGLGGGTGDLTHFLRTYLTEARRFKAPGMQHPVIVLIDNDQGANAIYSLIGQLKKSPKPTGLENFIHLDGNLYVVPTPVGPKNAPSMIEDFFDLKTRSMQLKGKSFDPSNDYETATHYGKSDFAHKIVQPNATSIDFTNFKPILDRFVEVIDAHAATHTTGTP